MPIRFKNCIYYHIGKTGGIALSNALMAAIPDHTIMLELEVNRPLGKKTIHGINDNLHDENYFSIVRKPAQFAHSFYYTRKRKGWNWQPNEFEQTCKSEIYNTFMDNVYCNPGIVLNYYNMWIKSKKNMMVGHNESLLEDVKKILDCYRQSYDSNLLEKHLKVRKNVGIYKAPVHSNWVKKIEDSEQELMEKYYAKRS